MSEKPDEDSKTEDATEKKQRDAIEKGNTPQSRELATLASLLAATCILLFMATQSTYGLTSNLKHAFVHIDVLKLSNSADALNIMTYFVGKAGELMLPPLLLLSLAGNSGEHGTKSDSAHFGASAASGVTDFNCTGVETHIWQGWSC